MHSVPLYPVLGNHEHHARLYFDYFSLPGNESWYSFNFGNAHFVVLDSDVDQLSDGGEQLAWLEDDLAASAATWKFVNFHHPPFSAGGAYHASDRLVRKNILHPIFERHGVDMVICGHDHNYERTKPIGTNRSGHAVTYVVAGNGGTPMRWAGTREWTVHVQRVFGFVTVDIDGAQAHLQAHDTHGNVIDQLLIDKVDEVSYAAYLESALDFYAIEDPVIATDHYEEGDDLFDEDLYEEALVEFIAAHEADPTCIEAVGGIADSLIELERFDEAIEWALRGLEILPQFPNTYETLVEAHRGLGDHEAALEWARRWLEVGPDSPDACEAMAEIHADRGDLDAAVDEMQRAISILPSDAELHFGLGALYERLGERESAFLSYARGLYWFTEEDGQDREDIEEYEKTRDRVLAWAG
jgi:tetratricopeptide (TPR) repeat protein